jgi:hypothetical protein
VWRTRERRHGTESLNFNFFPVILFVAGEKSCDLTCGDRRGRPDGGGKSVTTPDDLLGFSRVDLFLEAIVSETARFSETLASTNQSTRRVNPKEHNQNGHRRQNPKSHNSLLDTRQFNVFGKTLNRTTLSACIFDYVYLFLPQRSSTVPRS